MSEWRASSQAENDLLDIYTYGIRTFGRRQALEYLENLYGCFDLLASSPRLGRVATPLAGGMPRFEHRWHVVLYEEAPEYGIVVLAVVHNRSIRTVIG